MAYDALVFDLDGVLIDSEPLHERAKELVFARYDLYLSPAEYDAFKGRTDREVIDHVVARFADRQLDAEALVALKQQAYQELMRELRPVPGALAFLRQARAQCGRLALTTSATRRNQHLAFDKFNLGGYFDVVVTAEDIQRPKPDPQPYAITAEKLAVAPAACLVIEDSVNGVRSGVGAGCRVAGITTSFDASVLEAAGAHVVVDGFAALASHLGWDPPATSRRRG